MFWTDRTRAQESDGRHSFGKLKVHCSLGSLGCILLPLAVLPGRDAAMFNPPVFEKWNNSTSLLQRQQLCKDVAWKWGTVLAIGQWRLERSGLTTCHAQKTVCSGFTVASSLTYFPATNVCFLILQGLTSSPMAESSESKSAQGQMLLHLSAQDFFPNTSLLTLLILPSIPSLWQLPLPPLCFADTSLWCCLWISSTFPLFISHFVLRKFLEFSTWF